MTQEEAFEILKCGHNVFLTGAAGSGKTYLLNEFIRFLKGQEIGVGITASTGIAATHLSGLTIHSWIGMGINRVFSDIEVRMAAANKRVAKRLNRTEVLIIDEISMLDADRLNLVDRIARVAKGSFKPFGGMQVVLCGDFFQLPPVAKAGEPPPKFAYHSSAWKSADFKVCYLHEQYRQGDEKFLGVLNAIRKAAVDDAALTYLRARQNAALAGGRVTKLYSHNVDVDAQNSRELARLSGEARHYQMETSGIESIANALKKGCLAPEVLTVKKNAAVMFVKNNFEKGYVNGTLGTVTGFDEWGHPVVTARNGQKIVASPEIWTVEENGRTLAKITQVPLRLAWAITIHKSQGMTLDTAEIDLSDAFEKGMGYVALSRVRSLAGMNLLGFNDTALQVSPDILAFDLELQKLSETAVQELRSCPTPKIYSVQEIRESHPAAYQKWSEEEERRLIADFHAGTAIKTIAGNLGRKYGAIRSRLRKLGFLES